jgi:hypothetical protein
MRELVKLDPIPPWWYIHHPARWQLVGDEWLPWLSELRADPGVANVDKDGNTDMAEVVKRRQGWTIIPWDAETGGYCIGYEGQYGPVHLSKWQTPRMVAGQVRVSTDEAGYWAFCKRLVAENYIPKPDPEFIDVIIERQQKKLTEWEERAAVNPYIAQMLPAERALLEKMTAAKERLFAETDEAAPVKRGRK